MNNVVDLEKFGTYKTILRICDVTEKLVRKDRKLTEEVRQDKLRRVSRTRARCAEKLDTLVGAST